jgi:ribosome-associated heat shock protein Hsp15
VNKVGTKQSPLNELRVDKWLWAARFFKTRAAAVEAVNGGKVQVNGQRVKPAKPLRRGDRLNIRRGYDDYVVLVEGLNTQRRPAAEAALLYTESVESARARLALARERTAGLAGRPQQGRRPNKKERRQITRFQRRQDAD